MHLVPVTPPAQVQRIGKFDYVTADAARRRIYAAHTGSSSLLIVDADSGAILGQVEVGAMHGVAVDPATGDVFTGDGESRTVSEVDPVAMKVVATADVDGKVDAIAYDPAMHRVYANEDDGTRMFVVDTISMKEIGTVALPGHKPEYIAVDPQTHEVYQNIDNLSEIAVIDPKTLAVARTISTPDILHNHPLMYDSANRIIIIGGKNGLLETFTTDGKLLSKATIQDGVDQCDFDPGSRMVACAGSQKVTIEHVDASGGFSAVADLDVPAGVSTCAFDRQTHNVWIVWAEAKGDFVQELALQP
jgi:DNA-binding beta-propeller fold protein YncE